jgi:hypothetical protein
VPASVHRPERRSQQIQKKEEQRDHRGRRSVIPSTSNGRGFQHTQVIRHFQERMLSGLLVTLDLIDLRQQIAAAPSDVWHYSLDLWKYWTAIKVPILVIRGVESDLLVKRIDRTREHSPSFARRWIIRLNSLVMQAPFESHCRRSATRMWLQNRGVCADCKSRSFLIFM